MSVINKALIASYFEEIWNQRNYEFACQVIAPEHVSHNPAPDVPRTPDGLRAFAEAYHAAFPNLWIRIDFQVAEGDLVVTRWTGGGTHSGELMGIPPTYHSIEITGVQIDRIASGKIIESWGNHDLYGLLQQIEALCVNA